MIIKALMKVVDDAPTKSSMQYTPYFQPYTVSKERFDLWINYIYSVMKIISSYVDVSMCLSNINKITMQPNANNEYSLQVNSICQIILDFARTILNL